MISRFFSYSGYRDAARFGWREHSTWSLSEISIFASCHVYALSTPSHDRKTSAPVRYICNEVHRMLAVTAMQRDYEFSRWLRES
jgi:hypothetical protein